MVQAVQRPSCRGWPGRTGGLPQAGRYPVTGSPTEFARHPGRPRTQSRAETERGENEGNPEDGPPCEWCGSTRYVRQLTGLWACRRCALERPVMLRSLLGSLPNLTEGVESVEWLRRQRR